MQQKVVLCLALVCLAALPLFNARSLLGEHDALVEAAQDGLESPQWPVRATRSCWALGIDAGMRRAKGIAYMKMGYI